MGVHEPLGIRQRRVGDGHKTRDDVHEPQSTPVQRRDYGVGIGVRSQLTANRVDRPDNVGGQEPAKASRTLRPRKPLPHTDSVPDKNNLSSR